jgi:hypothetical protein
MDLVEDSSRSNMLNVENVLDRICVYVNSTASSTTKVAYWDSAEGCCFYLRKPNAVAFQ